MVKSANWERLLWIVALIPLGATYASSQQSPDLDRQLQQLKQQYEQTTQELQGRISAVELQIAEQKITAPEEKKPSVSVAQLAAEQKSKKDSAGGVIDVGAKFQGDVASEPSYDLLKEADEKIEKLQEREGAFGFHGYFRSGYGLKSIGGQLNCV